MKNNKNVVYDFTQTPNQPLAIMSAPLARKLLQIMVDHLSGATARDIIADFMMSLQSGGDANLEHVLSTAIAFVEERTLIDNVVAENWDAYKVEPVVKTEPKKNF
jgi:hypothetical protein